MKSLEENFEKLQQSFSFMPNYFFIIISKGFYRITLQVLLLYIFLVIDASYAI